MGILARSLVPILVVTAALIVLTALGAAESLTAQGIRGVVLDAETDRPIGGATVSLLDSRQEVVRRVLADSAGGFSVRVINSGRYRLQAERLGYTTVTSQPMDLVAGDTAVVELRMGVEAVPLAPLTVTAASTARLRNRALDEFYERQRGGWGTFYGPAEIERMRPGTVTNVLQVTPGIRIRYGRGTTTQVRMRATGGRDCAPTIYVDGMLAMSEDIDSFVSGSSIRAVEVYRRAMEVPGEYVSVRNWACGAILIWTSFSVDR